MSRSSLVVVWQHPLMFGRADPNATALDKDPRGSWIVAPIVRANRLLGFVSADAHVHGQNGPIERHKASPREIAFQCRALDIVADLAQYVLPIWSSNAAPAKLLRRRHTGGRTSARTKRTKPRVR